MFISSQDNVLKKYLDDIRRTKPLERSEEQRLFQLALRGNSAARQRLVAANMRFVLKVAIQYRGCPVPLPDLVSEGAMGLSRAVDSFDPTRGLKFISYAVWWIKAYITRAINEQGGLIRLPANQHLRLRKALRDHAIGVSPLEDDLLQLLQMGQGGMSFDQPVTEGNRSSLADVLADPKASDPEQETEIRGLESFASGLLRELPPREAQVLRSIFGIEREAARTLREVGESLDISHERVRQLRDQAIRRIRKCRSEEQLREVFNGCIRAVAPYS